MLREARVEVKARFTDKSGSSFTAHQSGMFLNQLDDEGKFAFERTE